MSDLAAAVEQIRELHRPHWYDPYGRSGQVWLVCHGCDEGAHAECPASWPCSTAEIVYAPEEIAAREPHIAECTEDHRNGAGDPIQPGAIFVRERGGPLLAVRWACSHVQPVPVDPIDPWPI